MSAPKARSSVPTFGRPYEHVAADLREILADLDLRAVAYDRWRIDLLRKEQGRLDTELPLLEWGQGYKDMSPALDALKAELLNGRLARGGHTVLRCAPPMPW